MNMHRCMYVRTCISIAILTYRHVKYACLYVYIHMCIGICAYVRVGMHVHGGTLYFDTPKSMCSECKMLHVDVLFISTRFGSVRCASAAARAGCLQCNQRMLCSQKRMCVWKCMHMPSIYSIFVYAYSYICMCVCLCACICIRNCKLYVLYVWMHFFMCVDMRIQRCHPTSSYLHMYTCMSCLCKNAHFHAILWRCLARPSGGVRQGSCTGRCACLCALYVHAI